MRDRLAALGWSQIETVDDDLGRSAAGGVTRAGFDRMVAEVCRGKVGAVAAREVSRFACNSRDWQQLIEMCRVVDAVLVDQEAVYAPRQGNDRLLLGLKGSLNEYELDLLRHKPVLKPVLEPFCFCRLSGRKGVQFKRRFRVSVRLPRARSLRRSLMRHSLNPDGKWQPGLGLCHDKIRVAVRRSWDGSANKAIPMCASFLS